MLLSLVTAGCLCCPAPVHGPYQDKAVEATAEVTLTETQPVARIQLPASVRSAPVPFLEIPITRIANCEKMGFSIFVYLEWAGHVASPGANQKILLGNFTVYPPDQPGSFLQRASQGFARLKGMGANPESDQIVLVLEMERVHPNKSWAPIKVTIGPVRWRAKP